MSHEVDQSIPVVRFAGRSVPQVVGLFVAAVGLVIIAEWTFAVKLIARFSPTDSSMKINTSIVFLVFGLSLALFHSRRRAVRRLGSGLTAFGLTVSALTLSQYVFGVDLGIDELVFKDHPNADITSSPGRMSPLVAFNFLLTGAALLYWRTTAPNGRRPAEKFGIAAFVIPVIVALGYLFKASSLYSFTTVTGVALITALLFLVLIVGVLAVHSPTGVATIILSRTRGGFVLRFLLPTSVLTIIVLDYFGVRASQAGLISANLVVPLSTLISATVIAYLIWRCAKLLFEADNAEQENLRELQAAYRAADEANRAKDEFISVVSHELRTPLNSILGWIRIIETKPSEDNVRRAFEVIARQSENQLQLVEDLLDTSRIITGRMRLEIRPIRLEKVVGEAVETVRPAAEAKNIALVVEETAAPRPMTGDPDRLQQVFWNLLSNAVKFTPRDGRIRIVVRPAAEAVEIAVSDTGEGIAPEFLPFVFERFRQADNSPSRRSGGLGLGLALVRNIVELHGGNVTAESQGEGRGATFTVTLPVREKL